MLARLLVILSGLAMVCGGTLLATPMASAAPACPDVDVVFARGTVEPAPPLGLTGLSFVTALRSQLPGKSVADHGVNYPASGDFSNRLKFAQTVVTGVDDAQRHITAVAAACSRTKIVLGGYSQGAVVAGYTVSPGVVVPERYRQYASRVPKPLPTKVLDRITALVLFAPPSDRFMADVGAPPVRTNPRLANRTVRYCIPGDTICDGAPAGQPNGLHVLYSVNGMTLDAARFVVAHTAP
ncbi:cutinase family protein [Gordonia sp. CPCC 205515]|uniref:cutinase family protein n=1 Tax=Gordonia sp. CPCC 205515 TaxID=3140791 RepID=UPI003AF3D032